MTQFELVKKYLEDAVGEDTIGAHGNFWRNLTIDKFKSFIVSIQVDIPLLTVGDGSESNLIKALKGQMPFGKNLGVPGAIFNQMPDSDLYPPMPTDRIEFIKTWIDNGCHDDPIAVPPAPGSGSIA